MTSSWALTEVGHPVLRGVNETECEKCVALAEEAVTMARVMGSVGATAQSALADGTVEHSATVVRAISFITRD